MATRGGKFQSAGETKTANRPEKCSQLIRRPGPFEQARRFLRGGNNESQVVLSDPLMLDLARRDHNTNFASGYEKEKVYAVLESEYASMKHQHSIA